MACAWFASDEYATWVGNRCGQLPKHFLHCDGARDVGQCPNILPFGPSAVMSVSHWITGGVLSAVILRA